MKALTRYSMDNSCIDFQTFKMTETCTFSQCLKCRENLYREESMCTQMITKNVVKGLLRMLNKIKKIKKKDREKTLFLIIGMLSSWSDSQEVGFLLSPAFVQC